MASTVDDPQMPEEVAVEPLDRALGSRYLQYALSTIMHRALPDARDGLKPVQRRILLCDARTAADRANGGFRKSAKIAGDVMGNYHPHGDAAIYDAMARLAQDFVVRYPLVDGQGNFGNIDGDNPAAARYTEARHDGGGRSADGGARRGCGRFPRQLRRHHDGAGGAASGHCPTCWPMGRAGSRWAWPPTFRRITSMNWSPPACI
jgi:hypothetical protein